MSQAVPVSVDSQVCKPLKGNKLVFSYEEAMDSSIEYFDGDELAAKVFIDKYAMRNNDLDLVEKTPRDMHIRIAQEFARIEKKKFKSPLSFEEIFSYLDKFKYIVPQGSPMYGIGNEFQTISTSNCFVIESPVDSYGGILKTDEELVQISKRRGGVGLDISGLRPSGTITHNAAHTTTGVPSFMERYSNSIREVGQNGRRGALMITISVHHPDIESFVNIKNDLTKITGANISVRVSDEFLNAVKNGEDYEIRFPVDSDSPSISNMIPAQHVWDKIIKNAHAMAEPGILFWDNITKESPSDCYCEDGFETISTNPCGEIPLSAGDSCRLLLLNLFSYVDHPFTYKAKFDFDKFYNHAKIAQRLMDDLIDIEIECVNKIIKKIKDDPEPDDVKIRELNLWNTVKTAAIQGRRTGTGITALGDTLAALGMPYASRKGLNCAEKIYKILKLASYRSSVDMAKELGPFNVWDYTKEKNNPFLLRIKEEDPSLYKDMKKYGRRNISLLTTAPAGSVSILTQTSSGIEPQFMVRPYTRRKKGNPGDENFRTDFIDQNGDTWMEFEVYPPKVKMWIEESGDSNLENSPWSGSTASELEWKERVKLQAMVQKHIDHSISSTINLPEDVSLESVDEIYRTAWQSGCKGITIYRDNCRTGVLISDDSGSKGGSFIQKTQSPKRPKDLPCEVHHTKVRGTTYFVIVGLLNGEPYEVFAGVNHINGHSPEDEDSEEIVIPRPFKFGIVRKNSRGNYIAILSSKSNTELIIKHIGQRISDDEAALTRLISTSLRHGAAINFVVHQLEKVTGDMTSFGKSIARALKKYIPDGTEVTGESCPTCETKDLCSIVRQEGCIMCKSCGWTKCS
jgi:ribonucleoside-diphosphate reductase alpha chain